MSEQFPRDAVIEVNDEVSIREKLFTNEWLLERIKNGFNYALSSGSVGESLVGEGIPCRVLEPGQFWKTGYLRIKVEFVPSETLPEQSEQA